MKILTSALATLLLAALCAVTWQHHRLGALDAELSRAEATTVSLAFEIDAARTSIHVVTKYVDRVRVVREQTTQLQREIPRYVTPSTDDRFPLSVGFVRLHDAAATGLPLGAPGAADATRSVIATSTATDVIAGNYGICRETAEQLTRLQEWVRLASHGPAQ